PIGVEKKLKPGERLPQMPFFPNYVLRDVLAWYCVIAVLAALAACYPWELGTKADPFAVVPPGIRPEWYFLAMFHTLKLLPSHVLGFEGERLGVIAFAIAALFLVLVPFLDRRSSRGEPSRLFTVIAVIGLVYLVSFSIIGHYPNDDAMEVTTARLPSSRRRMGCACLFVLFGALPLRAQAAPAANSCIACHSLQADPRLANPVKLFSAPDVHRDKGFEC